ncbi:MAG: hypothetical protein IPP46_16990 [Bacteroidetes bacterium]|nr:hypothetical protein [Bacteroidota bacterium]
MISWTYQNRSGKIVLEEIDFDLTETVDSVYQTLHLRAEEKKLNLLYTFTDEVPKWIKGDPTRLTQILINLTGNAIKFTPEGGTITIQISESPLTRFIKSLKVSHRRTAKRLVNSEVPD